MHFTYHSIPAENMCQLVTMLAFSKNKADLFIYSCAESIQKYIKMFLCYDFLKLTFEHLKEILNI